MQTIMAEQARAQMLNAEVLKSLLGVYQVHEAPAVRLNGDEIAAEKARLARLEEMGYPVGAPESVQLGWQLRFMGGDEL